MDNATLFDHCMATINLTIKCTLPSSPSLLIANSELNMVLEKMFKYGLHADMVLVSEGKEMKVSKNILPARSPVFAAKIEHKLE